MPIYIIITPAAQPLQTFAPAPSPSTTALAKAIFINQLSTAQRYALLTPLHAPQKILQPQPILESTMSSNTQSNRYRQLPSKRYRKKTPRSQIHITGGYCSNEASCVYTASHIRKMCRNCIKESKGCRAEEGKKQKKEKTQEKMCIRSFRSYQVFPTSPITPFPFCLRSKSAVKQAYPKSRCF